MDASPNIQLIEVPVKGNGGVVWNRLHSEREDICEALLKESQPACDVQPAGKGMSQEAATGACDWHRELLQARLRKVDDALDRLMLGTYGDCSKCGKWIEDTKLDYDPAIEFCLGCWDRELRKLHTGSLADGRTQESEPTLSGEGETNSSLASVALDTLSPFDTIFVRTLNSEYRLLLLDSKTGRSLVEGGHHFVEPVEAMVYGSTLGGTTCRVGWIGVGLRIEMWANDFLISTSPVHSIRVEHASPQTSALTSAVH
ncbi:MAG: hypothetical protein ACRD9S_20275 [Pyrinomonadaceae bacterium]